MSAEPPETAAAAGADDGPAERRARVELLEAENRRLREAYGRVHRTRHRRTAIGLAGVGLLALAGAAGFPAARTVLVALGAIGVFGGLLTWYLTPERFVAADVGERVYAALAGNEAAVVAELGLREERIYVPLPEDPDREAVLYIPQREADELPAAADLDATFVVPEDAGRRGVALEPTGGRLLAELREALPGGLASDPRAVADQLADGLREQFELVDTARPDVEPADGRASLAVAGSAYGAVDRFDHPVPSLFAAGLAVGLEEPVRLTVAGTPDARSEYLVSVRWDFPGGVTAREETVEEADEPDEGVGAQSRD